MDRQSFTCRCFEKNQRKEPRFYRQKLSYDRYVTGLKEEVPVWYWKEKLMAKKQKVDRRERG